ncbi:MAG: DUF3737 family protein [Clostridia bacterium]|nr:DUF3737 family protein [Clostridia bacterium]
MKEIANKNFSQERALYAAKDVILKNCTFSGEEDGESALKEAENITAEDCRFELRYPLWHNKNTILTNSVMTETCRAALWYSRDVKIENSKLYGIKAVRECDNVSIVNCDIVSPEFGWKSRNLQLKDGPLQSEYAFLMSENLSLNGVAFVGKYAFQYVKNAKLSGCNLNTKDAFWHAKDVTVTGCEVNGEYLGWYSENLTFINCRITGTQPLCYCKNLKLINCRMQGTGLAFEYSDVNAQISGDILSVKNPLSGSISADSIGEVIITQDSKYKPQCKIILNGKPVS